jgi:TP901 family phage tail tape measure protein
LARSDIKAGSAFVELYTKNSRFQRGLNDARRSLRDFGNDIKGMGQILATASIAMLTPIALAVKQFSGFEDALNSLRASANPTAAELDKIRNAAMGLSDQLKVRPTAIIQSFTELLKAGMSVETVLSGAGEAAVKFAKVGELEMSQAATVMADAMTVFGTDATQTTNTLSAAADASSISITQVAESFSMASAVAGLANQNLNDVAQAIAIMGNNGLKGSDAGTSLKTMFLSLMAPTDKGTAAMEKLGLSVRDAAGEMLPIRDIIANLERSLDGLAAGERDTLLRDLFGTDALRAGAIMLKNGSKGWDEFGQKMGESLTVAQKYDQLNKSLSASLQAVWASIEKLSIGIGEALAPELQKLSGWITEIAADALKWIQTNQETIVTLTKLAVGVGVFGGALMALGAAVTAFSAGLGLIAALASPLGLVVLAMTALAATAAGIAYLTQVTYDLADAKEKLLADGDKQRSADIESMERLRQLADQQSRTKEELAEAGKIIDDLQTRYGNLGLSIDTTTGQINGLAQAQQALNAAMAQKALGELEDQMHEAQNNARKLKEEFDKQTSGWRAWLSEMNVGHGESNGLEGLLNDMTQAELKAARAKKRFEELKGVIGKDGSTDETQAELNAAVTGGAAAAPSTPAPGPAAEDADVAARSIAAAEAAEKAAEEQKKRLEELDKLEEQAAKNRRSRVDQEIHEIKELAAARRKLLEESGITDPGEYLQVEADAAAAIADVRRKAADEEQKEKDRKEKERSAAMREQQAQIDTAKIDLDKSLTEQQKELAKLEIERKKALEDSMANNEDPSGVNELFDLRKQLIMQKGGGGEDSVAGTFSAAAAVAMGQGGGTPEEKMVKSLDEIRKLAKDQYEESKRQRREGAKLR